MIWHDLRKEKPELDQLVLTHTRWNDFPDAEFEVKRWIYGPEWDKYWEKSLKVATVMWLPIDEKQLKEAEDDARKSD